MLRKLWQELAVPRRRATPAPEVSSLPEILGAVERGDVAEAGRILDRLPWPGAAFSAGATAIGDFHLRHGEHDCARERYFAALAADPLGRAPRIGLALSYYEGGDLEESLLQLKTVLRLKPDDGEALIQQAVVHLQWGNLEYAEQSLDEGLAVAPDHPHGWNNLGILYQRQGKFAAAVACFRRAVALKPDFATAHGNLGLALREAEQLDEARLHLERATRLRPGSADGHLNLGTVLQDSGDLEAAESSYRTALEIAPGHAEATHGLGLVCVRRMEFDRARAFFLEALRLQPHNAAVRTSLGELELLLGEFSAGWAHYESRLDTAATPRLGLPWPNWRGSITPTDTVLVYWEQGLGDVILFASCVPDALGRVGRLIVDVPEPLQSLFARSFPAAHIVSGRTRPGGGWLAGVGRIDACAAMGSLMCMFRSERAQFPPHTGYLRAEVARVAAWRERLRGLGAGPKLGVAWRGGLVRTGRLQRSISLQAMQRLFAIEDTSWVSLQYGDCKTDLENLARDTGISLNHWPEANKDFDDLAALLVGLDGVVTVCNTIAHLAGALGVPALVIAPRAVSWRYQASGEKLPWYPSLTVLRQPALGEWEPVIAEAEAALRARLTAGSLR